MIILARVQEKSKRFHFTPEWEQNFQKTQIFQKAKKINEERKKSCK